MSIVKVDLETGVSVERDDLDQVSLIHFKLYYLNQIMSNHNKSYGMPKLSLNVSGLI